ncbi:MAG TPA: SCO family protein [Longimicrobiales bacterium]|nr:SCO family protein [Longimicrobiales bacterium]
MIRRIVQVAAGVALGLIVALLLAPREGRQAGGRMPDPVEVALIPDPFPAPPLALMDPNGDPATLASLRGSVVAVFFGYTHCPDVCPLTLATLGRLQEDEDRAPPLEVVFVSVDPRRDTPERLRAFAEGLPGRILAWTAEADEVRRQANAFGVLVAVPEDGSDPDYLVDHTARTFLVGPGGDVVATLPPMVGQDQAREVIDAVYQRYGR